MHAITTASRAPYQWIGARVGGERLVVCHSIVADHASQRVCFPTVNARQREWSDLAGD